MASGGLLEKAAQQQTGEPKLTSGTSKSDSADSSGNGIARLATMISVGMVLPFFIMMWFGGVFLGQSAGILTAAVLLISSVAIWFLIGKPRPSSVHTIAIGMSCILLLSSNLAISMLLTGEMSLGEIRHDADSDEVVVLVRQSGGSGNYDAEVSITQGSYVYDASMTLSLDRSDSQGEYGWLRIPVDSFYNENALPQSDYLMSLKVDGKTWTRTLDANVLSRTITGVDVSATPSFKTQDCEGSQKDQCLAGVALSVTAGLIGSSQDFIAPMPLADYGLSVTMQLEGSTAIQYPSIEVQQTIASWQSVGGEFGSGSGFIGDGGSTMSLAGSVEANDISRSIILKGDWDNSDYGCYQLTVTGTNMEPWSQTSIDHTTYYMYEETNRLENGQYSSESWTEVNSC